MTSIRSLDGQMVDTSGDVWQLRSSADGGSLVTLRWAELAAGRTYSTETCACVRRYRASRLVRRKPMTIGNDFAMFTRLRRWLPAKTRGFDWADFSESLARRFLAHGMTTSDKGNDFSRLRAFYEWGVATGIESFDPALLRILKRITAPGNAKGHHVRFRDPQRGPFSSDELLLIRRAIVESKGTDQDRAVVMLHLELGHNALATVRLKNGDFVRVQAVGRIFYHLDVPRVKKRTAARETKRRPISEELGELLTKLRAGKASDPLLHWLNASQGQGAVSMAMKRFVSQAGLVSPRTGAQLRLSTRRFRFSLATHMAAEGASLFHLAEVLDHSDTQNVRVYVETASSIADAAAMATDSALGPLVRRFQGSIADAADSLTLPVIPASAPHLDTPYLDTGGIGLCGWDTPVHGPCRLLPPVSCYLCPSFTALSDGPHRQMLESIDRFLRRSEPVSDPRVSLQLEDVRSGVQEVIAQIERRRDS